MNARTYKTIFVLLSACIFFILLVQVYWLRNFYLQKQDEFDKLVYSSLDKLRTKLQDRKNLQTLKTTYIIVDKDTIAQTPSRKMTVRTESSIKVINRNTKNVETRREVSVSRFDENDDSVVINGNRNDVNIHLKGTKGKTPKIFVFKDNQVDQVVEGGVVREVRKTDGVAKLIDKMLTEIKVLDTETENIDTLNALIKRSLANQGLFLPFEFCIQKSKDPLKVLTLQSDNFSQNSSSYTSDLSENKIIGSKDRLFLQFPNKQDFVMAGMKKSVALSLFFSLLVMSIFYYVIHLILKQKKITEIKNDFVNNMTHELKTPIATISLALDALGNPLIKDNEAKFQEYKHILQEENAKLNKHVERVLQMALLDKGELLLKRKSIDLVTVLKQTIHSYKLQMDNQQAEINFSFSYEPIEVVGDSEHLQTAFSNLIDNALKYSKENCKLDIHIQSNEGKVRVHFKDNGIGIEKSHQDKVFEKFYRAQGGNLHDVKGFGLGLSYVKSIVEAHGGDITLFSEKGKGSEFIITLKRNG